MDENIRLAQALLKYLGYYKDDIDDIWGPNSQEAMSNLAKAANVKNIDTTEFNAAFLPLIESYMSARLSKHFNIKSFVIGAIVSVLVTYIVKYAITKLVPRVQEAISGVMPAIGADVKRISHYDAGTYIFYRGMFRPVDVISVTAPNISFRFVSDDKHKVYVAGTNKFYFIDENEEKHKIYARRGYNRVYVNYLVNGIGFERVVWESGKDVWQTDEFSEKMLTRQYEVSDLEEQGKELRRKG